jgi:putative membrane protein
MNEINNEEKSKIADISDQPYGKFAEDELILRDHLAIDRTALANERTLLAYIRTALAISIAGASLIHFFDSALTTILGIALIPIGVITLLIGIFRHRKYQIKFKK